MSNGETVSEYLRLRIGVVTATQTGRHVPVLAGLSQRRRLRVRRSELDDAAHDGNRAAHGKGGVEAVYAISPTDHSTRRFHLYAQRQQERHPPLRRQRLERGLA